MKTIPVSSGTNSLQLSSASLCPYKGLMPYTEEDSRFFFGREKWRDILINNLRASRLTVLYGRSGVGKSSVLRAGVMHTLQAIAQQNQIDYQSPKLAVVYLNSWRDDPLPKLMAEICQTVEQLTGKAIAIEESSSQSLEQCIETATQSLGDSQQDGKLFIILDQFEEYFLYHNPQNQADTFAAAFPKAINNPNLNANFLISLRDDALSKLDRFKDSIPKLLNNRLEITHLDEMAASDAIRKPLKVYNQLYRQDQAPIGIEPELVKAVIDQVKAGRVTLSERGQGGLISDAKTPIETPFLQMVMTRLWLEEIVKQGGNRLTKSTLDQLQGANHIVKEHLDKRLNDLSPSDRDIAAHIFKYLVTPSGSKIAQAAEDLVKYVNEEQGMTAKLQHQDVTPLLEDLSQGDARIIRPVQPTQATDPRTRYEIFHDVLCDAILDWRRRYLEFQKRRDEASQQRQRWRHRAFWIAGISVVSTTVILLAFDSLRRAKEQQIVQQQLASIEAVQQAESGSSLKALLSAMRVAQEVDTHNLISAEPSVRLALQKILAHITEHNQFPALPKGILSSAQSTLSSDGALAATVSLDGKVSIWNLETAHKIIDIPTGKNKISLLRFLENDYKLLTATWDGEATVWNLEGKSLKTVKLPQSAGFILNISSDGEQIATTIWSDNIGNIQLWTFSGIKKTELMDSEPAFKTAFSPNGQLLATTLQSGSVKLWNTKGYLESELRGHEGPVFFVEFGPRGREIITGGQDGTIRVWDLNGNERQSFLQQYGPVYYLEVGPSGQDIAVASSDGAVRIFDSQGALKSDLTGHDGLVTDIGFPEANQQFVTITQQGTVRLWNQEQQQRQGFEIYKSIIPFGAKIQFKEPYIVIDSIQGHSEWTLDGQTARFVFGHAVQSFFDVSSQFHWISATDSVSEKEGQTEIKIFPENEELATLSLPPGSILWYMVISPDRNWLVTTSLGGEAVKTQLWRLGFPHPGIHTVSPQQLSQNNQDVLKVAFSPNSQLLATASLNGEVAVWSVSNLLIPQHTYKIPDNSLISALEFSPDNTSLAISAWGEVAYVWDFTKNSALELRGHRAPIQTVHFSSDGESLLTSSLDGTARVWDLEGNQWAEYTGHNHSGVVDAAFSPDGKQVATLSLDGYVQLWPIATFDELVTQGCNWLEDYLSIHPTEAEELSLICPTEQAVNHGAR